MLYFQLNVSVFNKDLHLSITELKLFEAMKIEIVGRGGTLFKELGVSKEEYEAFTEERIASGEVT